MIVRELITRLGFSIDNKKINDFDNRLKTSASRAEAIAGTIRNVFYAFAASSIIKTADELQNLRARLASLPQTQGDVGASFDELADRASKAGTSIDAYGALYVRIGNAAKKYITTQDDLLGITDTISKALAVSGASTQEAAAVMTQFSQALSSGVLQGDEFRSMAEAAPQYIDKLAEALNIPRENLKKLASDGKLTSEQVILATRKMSDFFGEKFQKMPMTVGRAITVVTNRLSKFLDKLNRESNFITALANGIVYAFDLIEAGLNKIIDFFGGAEEAVRFFGIALGVAIGAKALAMLKAFQIASLKALLPWLLAGTAILVVAAVLEDLYVGFKGGDSVIFRSIKIIGEYYEKIIMAVTDVIEYSVNAVKDFFEKIRLGITDTIEAVINFFKNIKNTALQYLGNIKDLIYNIFFDPVVRAFKDAFKKANNIFSFSLDKEGMGLTPKVSPAVNAAARPNVQNTTNVTVSVPQGTTAQQAEYLRATAQRTFSELGKEKIAREISLYAP